MNLKQHVATKIRTLRLEHNDRGGLSQEGLASALNVATNTVSRWETGTYWPSVQDLDKLARFFGVSVMEFFPEDEPPSQDEQVVQLLRAAKGLRAEDMEELRRYAEFRRARYRLEQARRKPPTKERKPRA